MQAAAVAAMVLPGAGRIEKAMPEALTAHCIQVSDRFLSLPAKAASVALLLSDTSGKTAWMGMVRKNRQAGKPSQRPRARADGQ
jgi:hypothetical protein